MELRDKGNLNCAKEGIGKSTKLSSYPRRTYNEIQEAIVECLEKLPRSTHGVAKACKMDWRVANRHLHHLEALGKLRYEILIRPTAENKQELSPAKYWKIKK